MTAYPVVTCSQCGKAFAGPRPCGFSHCHQHKGVPCLTHQEEAASQGRTPMPADASMTASQVADTPTVPLRILSLGAGVQSTTLALLAAHGEIPKPDCAIFADTGAEPAAVYEHLSWLCSPNVLPFPVHIVSAGNIYGDIEAMVGGKRWASIPAFVMGNDGRAAPITRQCTNEYKIEPIHQKTRGILGIKRGQSFRHFLGIGLNADVPILVEQMIGISRDEAERMKPSEHEWIRNIWPLIDLGMKRQDCIRWLESHDYPVPPKSACVFCPFTENQRWREMRDNQPAEWQKAIAIDKMIRSGAPATETRTGTRQMYLHRSLLSLDEVDLTDLFTDAGGFGNECEGVCGV